MKTNVKAVLVIALVFFGGNTFGQTTGTRSDKIKNDQVTRTYLDLLLNVVSTNFNYGKANGSFADYKKSTFGAQIGASFQAGITPKVSLVSEIYFIMKGGELNKNNPLTDEKTTLRFYALELPVLARFNVGKFYANAGPSMAYNFYGTRKVDGSTKALSFNNSSEAFKRVDAGIQLGAGYRFKIKQKSVVLDARYTYGLSNISNDQEMYNRYLNISLHFTKPWKTNPLGRK
ncbi:MAG: PorT family protein [Flammeovirgaceae bacterium]|nr:PorT family protein [Flammeovirgaceae bacterium]